MRDLFNQLESCSSPFPNSSVPSGFMIRHLQPSKEGTQNDPKLMLCQESRVDESSPVTSPTAYAVDKVKQLKDGPVFNAEEKALALPSTADLSLSNSFEFESNPLIVAQRLRDILGGVGKGQRVAPAGQVCKSFLRGWSQPLRIVTTEACGEESNAKAAGEPLEPISFVCGNQSCDEGQWECSPVVSRPLGPCLATTAKPLLKRACSSPILRPRPPMSNEHAHVHRRRCPVRRVCSFAARRENLINSLRDLRRVGNRPAGPVEELLAAKTCEEGETLLGRILEDTCDGPQCLQITISKLEASMDVAAADGAARHASVCLSERALKAAKHKYELLSQLSAGRQEFAANKNVLELKQIVNRVVHHEVPTKPEDNLHPRHRLAQQARREIADELERKAQRALEVAKITDSCDAIEQKIVCATFVGVPKTHPALVEAKKIADSLREAERLKQRRAFAEARQEKLHDEQVRVTQ